jgi:LysR family transcriptional regulator, benzoate and cis,cis-muconate-responsive activator of ben and cat genes
MVPVQRLEYLIAVAREGSFTRAAQELHVAQPALSRQVRLLEEQLGVALLERTPQGVQPTAAGELLIERAQRLIGQLDQALEDTAAVGRGERGTVTLGYTASSSHETVPRLVAWLRERLDNVEVRTVVLPRLELLNATRDGTVDLGIVRCFPPHRELVAWPLRDEPQGVLAHENHEVFATSCLTLEDAVRYPILLHGRGANQEHYDTVLSWFAARGLSPQIRERSVAFDVSHSELRDSDAISISGNVRGGLPSGLQWHALEPQLTLPIVLTTVAENDSPLLNRVLSASQQLADKLDWLDRGNNGRVGPTSRPPLPIQQPQR